MTGSPEPPVRLERTGHTLVVRLNRPRVLNAFDDELLRELGLAFREAAADDLVRAVVLTGAGRAFCAGADIKTPWGESSARLGIRHRLNPVILAMADVEKPVVAAINGVVAGAGLGFAGVCDTRLCAAGARFVPATVKLGIAPDGGMSYFLPRLIGPARAFRWLCTGEHIDSATAREWGLVDEVVRPDALLDRAMELAGALARAPGASVRLTKRLLRHGAGHSLAEHLEREQRCQDEAFLDPYHADQQRGADP